MGNPGSKFSCLTVLVLFSLLSTAANWEPELNLFSDQNSAEENRLAIIDRYGEWVEQFDRKACNFEFYEGTATPVFFLQWFLGATLESKAHYAECDDGQNNISHILIDVRSLSRPKQKFTIGMRSFVKLGDKWPYYSETTYASKRSFVESIEENQLSKTVYNVHHRYRSKPAEVESGEIQHPADLPNKAHTYASLMTHISDLVNLNDTFNFVLTDPYSAAIQDEALEYPMWRNEPLQVIKTKRNKDNSISMQGWFPYAFGQLYARINICFGESKLPDLIEYRHSFMDVDLWKSSGASSNQCKIAHDKYQAKRRQSRFSGSKKSSPHK